MFITNENILECIQKFEHFWDANNFPLRRCWLVGAAARLYTKRFGWSTGDLDIFVTSMRWTRTRVSTLNAITSFQQTGFGDWKIMLEGDLCVDLIFGYDIGRYLYQVPTAWDGIAVNLYNKAVLTTGEFQSLHNFEIVTRWTRKPKYMPYYVEHLRKQGIEATDEKTNA